MSRPVWEVLDFSCVYMALSMCPTRTSLMCSIQLRGSNKNLAKDRAVIKDCNL